MQNILIERIQRIDHLIRIKGTGTAADLADRLGISRAQIYRYISLMKENGAPIEYDHYRETYYYNPEGSFIIQFTPKLNPASTLPIPLTKTV